MTSPSLTGSAVIYGRVSTGQQTTSTQELRCKEYLQYKRLNLVEEFYDDDVSGAVAIWQRPSGQRLGARLQAGGIRHLIIAKLDRLGRKAADLLKTIEVLDSIGVILHIVDLGGDSLSTQGAAGRLMFTVLAGMAEYERELIRDRITKHLGAKRSKGELCGTEPYGFTAVETGEITPKGVRVRRLVDNVVEQQWILFMVQLRSHGHGYHTIAKRLNELGCPTKRRGEVLHLLNGSRNKNRMLRKFPTGKWQSGNVANVLNNQTVMAWLKRISENEPQALKPSAFHNHECQFTQPLCPRHS